MATAKADGRPSGTRIAARVRYIVTALAIVVVAVVGLGALGYHLLTTGEPVAHDNGSFRYGQHIMNDSVYRSLRGPAGPACRQALQASSAKPPGFDLSEAIAGCEYQEYELDN